MTQPVLQSEEFLTMSESLISPAWREQPTCSHEEFWTMAYADLGKRYGLNDIREAKMVS